MDITGMDKAYPIKGPYQIGNKSYHKSFEGRLGQDGEYYQEPINKEA